MRRRIVWAYATPSPIVCFLAAANVLAFVLSAHGRGTPSTNDLVAAGALTTWSLQSGEHWRLLAAGFLHTSVPHLLTNLASLFACGPTLERRLGPTAFTLVYVAALMSSSFTSVEAHGAIFIGVGASGAIIGLLGALFALWIMGKVHLHPRFFFINFGLLGAANVPGSHVDWAAHFGGFVGGFVSIALLDLFERAAGGLLRCKLPEFVKANTLILIGVGAFAMWPSPARLLHGGSGMFQLAAWGCGSMAFVMLLDLLLSIRRGLAGVVLVLAACNGLTALAGVAALGPAHCQMGLQASGIDTATRLFCPASDYAEGAAFAAAFAVSALLYAGALRRGLSDVGFMTTMLMAHRRRDRV